MKNTFIRLLSEKIEMHSKLVFISVDQSTGFDDELKNKLGDKFIMESISEQYVTGFASGLAADGFLPIIFNHAAFSIRRSYEQILLDCCLQKRKVIFLSMGGGYATAHLGPSHTTFDDIALARVMPNMETFVPCGSDDVKNNFDYVLNNENSIYVRLSKYGKYNLEGYDQYKNSKIYFKNYGESSNDICIISTGPISYNVSEAISSSNINPIHIHMPFLKNFNKKDLIYLSERSSKIFIFEEHSVIGGLYSLCSEVFMSSMKFYNKQIYNYGVNDCFIHKYGSQEDIWKHLDLDIAGIKKIING
jgi:transketolase